MKVRNGSVVKTCRLEKRWTQRDLSALCRCSQTTIYLIETGKLVNIKPELAVKIARQLGVPMEVLFEAKEASSRSGLTTDPRDTGRTKAA